MRERTTAYLPTFLKEELEREAEKWGLTVAEVIRGALMELIDIGAKDSYGRFEEKMGRGKAANRIKKLLEEYRSSPYSKGKKETFSFTAGLSLKDAVKMLARAEKINEKEILELAAYSGLKKLQKLEGKEISRKVKEFLKTPLARAVELYLKNEWKELYELNEECPECRELISKTEGFIQNLAVETWFNLARVFGEEGAQTIIGRFSSNPEFYAMGARPEWWGYEADPLKVPVAEVAALYQLSKYLKENQSE